MDFIYDILIPFFIGIFGIYFAYMLFDLLFEFSFGAVSRVKDDIKNKKTKYGKWLVIAFYIITIPIVTVFAIGNIIGESVFIKSTIIKIFSGLLGFILFVAFFDSPLHKKYKNSEKDK